MARRDKNWKRSEEMVDMGRTSAWPIVSQWVHKRGPDAPLSPRAQLVWRAIIVAVVAGGFLLVVLALLAD